MLILGLNAYNAGASAAVLTGGELTAAVEEERFTRIKHSAGFPYQSVKFCVESSNYQALDLSHVAICRNPKAHFWEKVMFTSENVLFAKFSKIFPRPYEINGEVYSIILIY